MGCEFYPWKPLSTKQIHELTGEKSRQKLTFWQDFPWSSEYGLCPFLGTGCWWQLKGLRKWERRRPSNRFDLIDWLAKKNSFGLCTDHIASVDSILWRHTETAFLPKESSWPTISCASTLILLIVTSVSRLHKMHSHVLIAVSIAVLNIKRRRNNEYIFLKHPWVYYTKNHTHTAIFQKKMSKPCAVSSDTRNNLFVSLNVCAAVCCWCC